MSEPIPESIPTSTSRVSQRPTKKRALTPTTQQSAQVEALFAHPDRAVTIPTAPRPKTLAPPPEIVANVQGSSAGAGSGEFHVYKASRRREYERLRLMDEEVERERRDAEFEKRRDERAAKDEEKLGRNRAKRAKQKARREKAEGAKKNGGMDVDGLNEEVGEVIGKKPKLGGATKSLLPKAENGGEKANENEDDSKTNGHGGISPDGVDENGITFHDDD